MPDDASDLTDPPLGPRLRELRRRSGLSIRAAAEQAGLSASFLSMVEREQSDLAMSRLMRLLGIYGASLTDLVDDARSAPAAPSGDVVRGGEEIHVTSAGEHIDVYMLVADTDRPLVPMVWVYAPGAAMSEDVVAETDQFSYVVEGAVTVDADDASYRLTAGDTIYMRTGRRFRIRNDSALPARVLGLGVKPDRN